MGGKLWRQLFNPGGGLRYHARATLFRRSRWKPFRESIDSWLCDWLPASEATGRDLLLIAPSAGHCLPSSWLGNFHSVTAMDLDPMAPIMFRRNHGAALPSSRLHWIAADVFEEWENLLRSHPHHIILFCNFLGQAHEVDERRAEAWFQTLPATLKHRKWASFHDRYSGSIATKKNALTLDMPARAPSPQLLAHFYSGDSRGELCEHELPPIFPENAPYHYWSWELASDQFHIIEGFRV